MRWPFSTRRPKTLDTPKLVPLGLSERDFQNYEDSKRNHITFISEQLRFEGRAIVPEDSLEWIVPGLNNKHWRSNTVFQLSRVAKGVQITMLEKERVSLDNSMLYGFFLLPRHQSVSITN